MSDSFDICCWICGVVVCKSWPSNNCTQDYIVMGHVRHDYQVCADQVSYCLPCAQINMPKDVYEFLVNKCSVTKINSPSQPVVAKTQKLKAKWTVSVQEDLANYQKLGKQIADDIDKEILENLKKEFTTK